MYGEYYFGLGRGWLSARADRIARKHGASLVNHTDDRCNCGYNCRPGTCKQSRRHWFAGPNRGEPFDSQLARAVMDEIESAGLLDSEAR
jgi:hypothetical protein